MLTRAFNFYVDSFRGLSKPVWILAFVMLINRSGTMVLPFMSLYLTTALEFSMQHAGWVLSSFGLGSLAGVWVGGKLSDRIGYMPVQVGSMLISGVFFILLLTGETLWELCLLTFLTSFFGDAFRPANMSAIGALAEKGTRTRSIALMRLAINLGFAFGPAIGGIVSHHYGFQWLFIIDGTTCIFAGFYLWWALSGKRRPAVPESTEPESEADQKGYKPAFLWLILGVFFWVMAFFQLFYTVPVFFENDYNLQKDEIGWLMAINGLIIALIEMPIVKIYENRVLSYVIITGSLLTLLSFAVFLLPPFSILTLCIAFTLLISIGEVLYLPFTNSLALELAPEKQRGRYMGAYSMVFALAHIMAPTLGMQLAENFGFFWLWAACTAMPMVVIGLTLRTRQLRLAAG